MVTVDYASSFFVLDYLPNTTYDMIVSKLKHHFAMHGCPEYLISDNGPQYTLSVIKKMVQQLGIAHVVVYPLPFPFLIGGWGSDLLARGPTASFCVHVASGSVTPAVSVH